MSRIELAAVYVERYPIRGGFAISRGAKREAEVVVAELGAILPDGRAVRGRGECVPYARYGETVAQVIETVRSMEKPIANGPDRHALGHLLPAGAARNALDCAFWDLEAKVAGISAWRLAGLTTPPTPVLTAFTLSLASPAAMGEAAAAAAAMPLLKLKLGAADDDIARAEAVRRHAPGARLIVDANEGWTFEQLATLAPKLAEFGVELIEQPLPAADDSCLAGFRSPIPLSADESCHGVASLAELRQRYQVVNIKLDKTGGLTEALRLKDTAKAIGFGTMVGCMVGTSLAMAPAFLLAQGADYVDLDGPLLLENDRVPGLSYEGAWIQPPPIDLWG